MIKKLVFADMHNVQDKLLNQRYFTKIFLINLLQLSPVNLTPFNRTLLPSETNCQGTEFFYSNILCLTFIIGQSRYSTTTAKF